MFAAIYIPDFSVEALIRLDPSLRGQAVAVVDGRTTLTAETRSRGDRDGRDRSATGDRGAERSAPVLTVMALNERARMSGIEPGMTKLQAEGHPQVTVLQRSQAAEESARAALLDCAHGFSPRVEDTSAQLGRVCGDTVQLDIRGLEQLFGAPAKIARDIARRCSEMGLEGNVAVAPNLEAALHAARGFAGVTVMMPGEEAQRLAALPVDVLLTSYGEAKHEPRSAEILETLERWGIRTLRSLAALPEAALSQRLGQEGLRMRKLAQGVGTRVLVPVEAALRFEEAMELEYPVEELEPLSFLLSRMLEQLCARLMARALATKELTLELRMEIYDPEATEEDKMHRRTLHLPVPMQDARVFLKLLQLDLRTHPPTAAVDRVRLVLEPVRPRNTQADLFDASRLEAEKLEVTLARLKNIVGGEERVGSPEVLDTHKPDAFAMKRFYQQPASRRPEKKIAMRTTRRRRDSRMDAMAAALGEVPADRDREPALETAFDVPPPAHRLEKSKRCFRPAIAMQVRVEQGRPAHVGFTTEAGETVRGTVEDCAGPWRTAGEWWSEEPWSRDEFDVRCGGKTYCIYRDLLTGKWWVHAEYD